MLWAGTLVCGQQSSRQTSKSMERSAPPSEIEIPKNQWRGLGRCAGSQNSGQPWGSKLSMHQPGQVTLKMKADLLTDFNLPSPFMPLCHCTHSTFIMKCFSLHLLLCLDHSPFSFTFPRDQASVPHSWTCMLLLALCLPPFILLSFGAVISLFLACLT